jgi:hypothetical protein
VGTAIIAENDAPAVSTSNILVDDIVVGESQTYADFLVRLDQPNTTTVTVHYGTYAETGSDGTDYLSQSGILTFAPGEMVKTVRVTLPTTQRRADRELHLVPLRRERQRDDCA